MGRQAHVPQLIIGREDGSKEESPLQKDVVTIGGRRLESPLSRQEFDLLFFLYRNYGRACSRKELGEKIWGAGNHDYGMLYQLVHRLRQKIEPVPNQPRYITTVPGYGYQLILEPRSD